MIRENSKQAVVEGDFWINAQDPYEPLGIEFTDGSEEPKTENRLVQILRRLGVESDCDPETVNKKRLRITIEVL